MTERALRAGAVHACESAGLPRPAAVVRIVMPPTWRGPDGVPYTYVFVDAEPDAAAVRAFYARAVRQGIDNPRLFWPETLALASLFHPLFFAAVSRSGQLDPDRWGGACSTRALMAPASVATVRFWLQSVLFLAGVTLSAAVVQSRWSAGTIGSKLDRLWQAAHCAPRAGLDRLAALGLDRLVRDLAGRAPSVDVLVELKAAFGRALAALAEPEPDVPAATLAAEPPDADAGDRFGFCDDLRRRLGDNLETVIVYGSSVTSASFADYDAMLVVADGRAALRALAGSHPSHRGVELNLSVFDPAEFATYQCVSGDNLTQHARCLWGEEAVPVKPVDTLLLRNHSFGYVRMRQLVGMAAHAQRHPLSDGPEEKRSLYGYFAKIPVNVAKGIGAAVGEPISKEHLAAWMRSDLGYDARAQLRACEAGRPGPAIATAAWATVEVMRRSNAAHPVYERVPAGDAQLWRDLERPMEALATGAAEP